MSDEPFFTAEDFKLEWETPDGVRFAAESKTGTRIAKAIAAVANAKFNEWLKKQPVIYGRKSRGLDVEDKRFGFTRKYLNREMVWSETGFINDPGDTHKARLVDIQELK